MNYPLDHHPVIPRSLQIGVGVEAGVAMEYVSFVGMARWNEGTTTAINTLESFFACMVSNLADVFFLSILEDLCLPLTDKVRVYCQVNMSVTSTKM
jgi:hypothetical protein